MFDDDWTKLHYLRRAATQEATAESYRQWLASYERAKLDPYNKFMDRKMLRLLDRGAETL